MSDCVVTLALSEMLMAANVAVMRRVHHIKRQSNHRFGYGGSNAWEQEIFSCFAELAVAKALNLYWSGEVGNYDLPDVGGIVEVRAVRDASRRLIAHPDDNDFMPYVLALVDEPRVILKGWLLGRDAKRDEWLEDPSGNNRTAFFVPTSALRPIPELEHWLSMQTAKPLMSATA